MTNNPLAAIEFVAFIGLVIWLFFWQRGNSRGAHDEKAARQDEHSEREQ